jgi:organic radical activating enzyme
MEAFYTIQGEGYFTGTPAYFIRLGGCDVGCIWCDVKDSWDAARWPEMSVEELVRGAKAHPSRLVVITGGEPLMYDMGPLTSALKAEGFMTNIETSGAHPLSGSWDWVCFSPKKFKQPHFEFYQRADSLKVVIYNKSDFAWAESHASKVNSDCLLYLQPEWEKSDKILPEVLNYVKNNPHWKISLQTHKFMNIP